MARIEEVSSHFAIATSQAKKSGCCKRQRTEKTKVSRRFVIATSQAKKSDCCKRQRMEKTKSQLSFCDCSEQGKEVRLQKNVSAEQDKKCQLRQSNPKLVKAYKGVTIPLY